MRRVKLDKADVAVKKFLRSLPIGREGLELELNGEVLCKVIPAVRFTEAEKKALIQERWELMRRAREGNKAVPAKVLEREVREAVEEVRRRQK